MDYLIADELVIPENSRQYYSEEIAYLPGCYQPNDGRREISSRHFSRAELGLPEHGFVFCCFNNNYKITPEMFDCWMRILKNSQGSVLWLLQDNEHAADNLKRQATAHGIPSDRLVFAPRMPLPEHLARHKMADLFLDTLPYNAHTTASDALWAGLPLLTCIGSTFPGRVAASLLSAVGLDALIANSLTQYEEAAITLASRPGLITRYRDHLAAHRLTSPLFDALSFTKSLEQVFEVMRQRVVSGADPSPIWIKP
jgi:predicted O-linked N-acetylglucosamine transferase (SPINDLY family)